MCTLYIRVRCSVCSSCFLFPSLAIANLAAGVRVCVHGVRMWVCALTTCVMCIDSIVKGLCVCVTTLFYDRSTWVVKHQTRSRVSSMWISFHFHLLLCLCCEFSWYFCFDNILCKMLNGREIFSNLDLTSTVSCFGGWNLLYDNSSE